MEISIEWLKEYVEINESPKKLQEDLTTIGLLVESVEEVAGTHVLDIEVTSNRPDCLSHVGIAREVAAFYSRPLRLPPVQKTLTVPSDTIPYEIEIKDEDLCPRYVALVLDGITVGTSPAWMQNRLEAAGMRPLNNIVDITNYVLLELGHPLHAFDYDVLRQGKIVVARARDGQHMETLDGIDRTLDSEMLLINDGEGPVGIAGVMGGLNSEISSNTTRVLLESAYFQPSSIRRTSKKLGLSTEASYRFERGADWDNTVTAIARTCHLIEQFAGGRIAGSLKDVYPVKKKPARIALQRENATALIGAEIGSEFIESTLQRLEFKLERQGDNAWEVECPTFRADMELEADLIEELARYHGYQNIPATLPPSKTVGIYSPIYGIENAVRHFLVGQGYSEAINLSFASGADHEEFPPLQGDRVAVKNPLTEDTQFMRSTLAPGLIRSVKRNFNYSQRLVRLFEIGKTYSPGGGGVPVEKNILGILGTGGYADQNWMNPSADFGFFHLKGLVSALLQTIRIRSFEIVSTDKIAWLNPAEAAVLEFGDEIVGVLGSLSASLEDKYKLKQPVYIAEIDFEALVSSTVDDISYRPLSKFPSVERDMSIVVNCNLAYGEIHRKIAELKIPELMDVSLIDVYEGKNIPDGKISLTVRLIFQDPERTLTIDRVQNFVDTILSLLKQSFGAELRSL
jgi:phenylalanyl-tRNA synthetase beta chain